MSSEKLDQLMDIMGKRFISHPWHGVSVGDDAPEIIRTFIEIVPTDTVKYEIDKDSGYMMVDRPQKFSNIIPAMYGFVPQTYCDEMVAAYCREVTGRDGIVGDGDPLDICVLTERDITHGNLMVEARPIGGFRMIDGGEADDKIVAVLKGDPVYEQFKDISDCPEATVNRLKHYFLTYKDLPGNSGKKEIEITDVYGKQEALEVIKRSQQDYQTNYGDIESKLKETLGALIS